MRAPSSSTMQTRQAFAGGQRLALAQRRRVDLEQAAGVEHGRALGHGHLLPVDRQLDGALLAMAGHLLGTPPGASIADMIAPAAVCPRPQIDESRMQVPTSPSSASSSRDAARGPGPTAAAPAPPPGGRCRPGRACTARRTRRGRTPRSASASARGRPSRRTPPPRPSRASRRPRERPRTSGRSELVGTDEEAGRAAQQHRLQRCARRARRRRARAARRSVSPNGTS